jgi:hypothetical protein
MVEPGIDHGTSVSVGSLNSRLLGVPCKTLHTKTNALDGQQSDLHFTKSIGFAPKQIGTAVRFRMGKSQGHIALQLALPDIFLLNKDVQDVVCTVLL